MTRRSKVIIALVALLIGVPAVLMWSDRAVDRDLERVAQEVFDMADFSDSGDKFVFDRTSTPGVSCDGHDGQFTSYGRKSRWTRIDDNAALGAERTAQALIADGWTVERSQTSSTREFVAQRKGWLVTSIFSPDEVDAEGPIGSVQISVLKRPDDCEIGPSTNSNNRVDAYVP